jgi:DNA-binding MarR family transcriptional regulator
MIEDKPRDKLSEVIGTFSNQFAQLEALTARGVFSDLTMRQVSYLETLGKMNKPGITDLAGELRLSKPSVSLIVDKLCRKGYVHKKPDENDKRRFRVLLTSRGLELNKMHQSMHNRLAEHLTKVLSDIEQEMFVTLLDKVIQSLK